MGEGGGSNEVDRKREIKTGRETSRHIERERVCVRGAEGMIQIEPCIIFTYGSDQR